MKCNAETEISEPILCETVRCSNGKEEKSLCSRLER